MFKQLVEDFKAWRRGERRTHPRGVRGRIYAKRGAPAASPIKANAEPIATLTMKITRANGTVETVVVPASVKRL